ncbi:uncharacterized protein LOC122015162 isoform X1 [Zingiber officinale]|uniref:uncharacterized protein LOC122015162 isoform X1 n=1 Tax=Zingiber officinale TaxID=94328 RepID=UPI001C4A802A|nr:uncharacterized protein LOC122015162 isoform X1 [Zingiber officinale]
METLRKLERVHSLLSLMEGRGISSGNADADRFLADFIFFLVKPCGIVTMDVKLKIISEFLPKISPKICDEVFVFANEEDCQQIDTELPLQSSLQKSLDTQESKFEETPMIGLDAMKRANSTLEDFCRSYFMFHGLDGNNPKEIFKYLPFLSFTESYIYQLDTLNEKELQLPSKVKGCTLGKSLSNFCRGDPFDSLVSVLQFHGLLTVRIRKELNSGLEYWSLERKLCHALSRKKKIVVEDVLKAIHLKSFDYRVLNLLLYQLRGEQVNELHMEFLSVSEYLVELADDLYDYEDDVMENSFNVLRMFVRIYGASAAPCMLAQRITDAEKKYECLSRTLDQELSTNYWRRCEEATREGGLTSGHAFGTWNIPPVIVDEESFRLERMKVGMCQDT